MVAQELCYGVLSLCSSGKRLQSEVTRTVHIKSFEFKRLAQELQAARLISAVPEPESAYAVSSAGHGCSEDRLLYWTTARGFEFLRRYDELQKKHAELQAILRTSGAS